MEKLIAGSGHQSLEELAEALRSGRLSPLKHLQALEAHFSRQEARVEAFLPETGRFARLRREARALLEAYPEPRERPPLFAVPVGVKDIFHVQGFTTRAGSALPTPLLQGSEAAAVRSLKRAGALVLGKTVTTEFAYFAPGPTRNPRALDHTPGGSSSGSAAAVAAGLCPLALGTQTIGSIGRPAAYCGVVGFKPSYDRIARAGVIPVSPWADHVGFFVPAAADARLVASVLCADWRPDPAPPALPVLGIPEGPYLERPSASGRAHFDNTCARLRAQGLVVKRIPAFADFDRIYHAHNLIVAAEAAQTHAPWYDAYKDHYHEKTKTLIEYGRRVTAAELAAARPGRQKLQDDLHALMDTHGVDLWLSPGAVGTAPPGLQSTGDPVMNLPWSYAGLPAITLPSGHDSQGLPFGLQVASRWQADEQLLAWAPILETYLATEVNPDGA